MGNTTGDFKEKMPKTLGTNPTGNDITCYLIMRYKTERDGARQSSTCASKEN